MNQFVGECRKEWSRLGVPDAVANEMAADLSADLAEAEAEGASPEDVLGNGVFDARSFAASWATARGVVPDGRQSRSETRSQRWTIVVSAVVSLVAVAAGLAIVGYHHEASVAVSVFREAVPAPFARPRGVMIHPPLPPGRLVLLSNGPARDLGVVLLVAGVVGVGLTLWLWRPWSARRRRSGVDDSVGMPSYL